MTESDLDDTDADVRSLAFLGRLTEVLHVSPFYSHLECGTVMSIGTSSTPFLWYILDLTT